MRKIFTHAILATTAVIGTAAQTQATLPDFDEDDVTVITTRPPGRAEYYTRAGLEVSMTSDGPEITEQDGLICVVYGTDGNVWLKNPVSNDVRESWVKGVMQADGVTVTVSAGQFTDYMPSLSFGRQLWVLDYNAATGMYAVNPEVTEITYSIADGAISLENTSQQRIIGSIFRAKGEVEEEHHYEGTWSGYGNYGSVYTRSQDISYTIPAAAAKETFTFRAPVNTGGKWYMNVMDATLAVDGTDIYLSGFVSSGPYLTETDWTIKGRKEGDTLLFATGQFLGLNYDNPYYLAGGDTNAGEISFSLSETGIYESDDMICLSDMADGGYAYFYYDGATLSQQPLPALVTPPAHARQHLYQMTYQGYIQSIDYYYDSSANVTVATTGNKVYVKGLYVGVPDAWIEGDIADNRVTFKSPQYLGYMTEQYPEMWFMAFGDQFDKPLDNLVFDYDPQTGALTNASANISVSICDRRNLGLQWCFRPSLGLIETTPAVPADPRNLEWQTYDWDPIPRFVFEIPSEDVTGTDIVEDWLYYRIYMEKDGVQTIFAMTPDTYPEMNLTEPLNLFPYEYFGYDITFSYGAHYMNMRCDMTGVTRIGVQSVYDAGGTENTSDIVWIDLPQTGLDQIETRPVSGEHIIYDIQGRPVTGTLSPGIYICNRKKIVIR